MNTENQESKTLYAKLGRGILLYFWDHLVISDKPIEFIMDFNKQILQLCNGLTIDKSKVLLDNYYVMTYQDEIDLLSVEEMKSMLKEVVSYVKAFQSAVGDRCLGIEPRQKVFGVFEKYISAANMRLIENHSNRYLQTLKQEFEIKSKASPIGKDRFKTIEKEEFELLFGSDKSFQKDYLENRLYMTSEEIEILRNLRIPFNDGQYTKLLTIINARQTQAFGKLLAIKEYIDFLAGNKNEKKLISTSSLKKGIQPNYPNLMLRPEFYMNIEPAYKQLRGEFIACSYEEFRGILVKGEFVEKVRLCGHTTVAEMKLFISEIKGCINVSSKWNVSNTLFIKAKNDPMTENSFNTAKVSSIVHDREIKIKEIANIIKTYNDL